MRSTSRAIRRRPHHLTSGTGHQPAPAVRHPAAALALPERLLAGAPLRFDAIRNAAAIETAAGALHKCRLLETTGDLCMDVAAGFRRWADGLGKGLPQEWQDLFTVVCSSQWNEGTDFGDDAKCRYAFVLRKRADDKCLMFDPRRAVGSMEKEMPGLGASVLALAQSATDKALGRCFGARDALDVARYHYWYGGESETSDEAQDGVRDDYCVPEVPIDHEWELTRAQFDREIPRFLFHHLKIEELKTAATKIPRWKTVIEAAVALHNLPEASDIHECGAWDLAAPVIMFWRPFGMVGRLFDLQMNDAFNNGTYHGLCTVAGFIPSTPARIIAAMRRFERLLDQAASAAALIRMIAKPVHFDT